MPNQQQNPQFNQQSQPIGNQLEKPQTNLKYILLVFMTRIGRS
jgi:hypothetical protein